MCWEQKENRMVWFNKLSIENEKWSFIFITIVIRIEYWGVISLGILIINVGYFREVGVYRKVWKWKKILFILIRSF